SRGPRQRMERAPPGLRAHLHRPGGELRRREAFGGPTSHDRRAFRDARTINGGRIAHCLPLTGPVSRLLSGRPLTLGHEASPDRPTATGGFGQRVSSGSNAANRLARLAAARFDRHRWLLWLWDSYKKSGHGLV